MKKVLYVLSSGTFSGAENVAMFIINHLKTDYNFLYTSKNGQIKQILEENQIDYRLMNKFDYKHLKYIIKNYNPDIIHAHDVRATILSSFLKKREKLIAHIHVNNNDMSKINIKTILLLIASLRVDKFFWVSESCFEGYIFKKFILNKSEILKNILSYDEILKKADSDKANYSYDVVYVGRLSYQKNPERLMQLCHEISMCNPNLKIGIVGVGEFSQYVKEYIENNNLINICYEGYKNNPLKIIKDSKVMIMTSRFEGIPMVALEAMALGIPIVSTPVDGMLDLINNGYNGYITDDNRLFIEYVINIVENKSMQDQMSTNAVTMFKNTCDEDKYFEVVKRGYEIDG